MAKGQESVFDFCKRNNIKVTVTYSIGEEVKTVDGLISGFFKNDEILCVKAEKGHDHCIPVKNFEKLTMKGKY